AALHLGHLAGRRQLAEERAELELREEGPELLPIRALPAERLQVEREREIAADGGEVFREPRGLSLARQRFAHLLGAADTDLLDPVEPLQDLLDRAELPHERA